MSNWLVNPPNDEIRAIAAELKTLLHSDATDALKTKAIAEVITPILTDRLYVEDIWAQIINEEDWTDRPIEERKFRIPAELVGATRILTYQNGQTFSQFTFNRRQIGVETEELTTPEFVIDTRELRRTDPIVTVADVEEAIRRMFIIFKAKKGYDLLTSGFDIIAGATKNVTVIADDGTYGDDGQLAFLPTLRDTVEEICQNLQASIGGNPQLKLATEALTLARLKRSGLSADWERRVNGPAGSTPDPRRVVHGPALEFPLSVYAFPTATDNINGFSNQGRPIITPGDLLLIGPNVASIALTEPLDPSIIQTGHWTVAYAWRAGYAYVRWSDKGDTNRMSRIMVVRKVGVGDAVAGVLVLDNLSADGANFYATRPIDKTTLTNSTVIISATTGGGQATGALTPVMKGDLRHFRVNFATPLTPGTLYYVRTTTGVKDVVADACAAMVEVVPTCG